MPIKSYPIIILGAGASFDYIHDSSTISSKRIFQPPLTSNLFDPRFENIIKRFKEMEPLSGTVAAGLRNGQSFENILMDVKNKVTQNSDRQRQLIALEFYLQELFKDISNNYGGQSANNYHALVQEIKDNGGQAVLATFNYDTLLDRSMGLGGEFGDYVNGDIKLIKIHGSCDWHYIFNQGRRFIFKDYDNIYQLLIENPGIVNNNNHRGQLLSPSLYSESLRNDRKLQLIPALAIPLPSKNDFICPPEHFNMLINALRQTKQILIIGWSASDEHFIKIIEDNITPTVSVTIVSGGQELINGIKKKMEHLEKSKKIVFAAEHIGFSNFMGSTNCRTFFNQMHANLS